MHSGHNLIPTVKKKNQSSENTLRMGENILPAIHTIEHKYPKCIKILESQEMYPTTIQLYTCVSFNCIPRDSCF